MIIKVVCSACEETLSIVTAHDGPQDGWGSVLVCREEIEDLIADLRRHRRDMCAHYLAQRQEYVLRKLNST